MARGIFTLKQQLQGLQQKSWNDPIGTYAASFNGTSQYLTSSVNANLALGTSSFTVEYWFYMYKAYSGAAVATFGAGTAAIDAFFGYTSIDAGQPTLQWYLSSNGSSWDITGGYSAIVMRGNILINAWNHVAFVRNGTTFSMYINGQLVNSGTSSASIYQTANSVVLGTGQTTAYFPGLISNFRFVKGTALYTANFTPPSRSLTAVSGTQLLTLQNSTFVDNSSNGITFTNTGSVPLQQAYPFTQLSTPAVDYLVVAGGGCGGAGYNSGYGGGGGGGGGVLQGSVPVTAGTTYTVTVGAGGASSSSFYGVLNAGAASVFGSISAVGGGPGAQLSQATGTIPSGGSGGGGGGYSSAPIPNGQGTFGQGNAGGTFNSAYYTGTGGGGAGTTGLGNPSNSICGNGGAGIASVITGTVAVFAGGGGGGRGSGCPSATVGSGGVGGGGAASLDNSAAGTSGTANTGGGGGAGSTTGNGVIGTSGAGGSGIVIVSYPDVYAAATVNTSTVIVSTSGSGSIAFSGTSQYITTLSASALAFGTNNFTVEGFVYFTSIGATGSPKGVLQISTNSAGINAGVGNSVALGSNATGGKWEIYAGAASTVASSAAPIAGTWYHFAIVRNSGTTVLYINGTSVISVADSVTYTGTYLAVGAYYDAAYGIPGYVSNLRIVNGVAVYTGSFSPPVIPLTTTQPAGTNISAVTGTSTALLLNTVSGAQFADSSTNSYSIRATTGTSTWSQLSPFATGLGYKNRVYTFNSSGTITF
jgi:hypothetical protein